MISFDSAPSGLIMVGDKVLTNDQYNDMFGKGTGARAAVAMGPGREGRKYLWQNNQLFYDFDNVGDGVKMKVRNTLFKLKKKLDGCIDFQERSSSDRVIIKDGHRCSASLGYKYVYEAEHSLWC